jgi:uncharacterized protein (DUF2236 family)
MKAPAYDGLFPPDSVTWRVQGDPLLWVGGLRALLLQAVHPAAMAGVLAHSDFSADPWGRLFRTAQYVGIVSFGTRAEVAQIGAHVRGLHARVSGTDEVTGASYRATDPELLRWVHGCEVESVLTVHQRGGGGLDDDEVDRYYAEQTRAAAVVGLDPATVPDSAAAMAEYFASMRPALAVDDRTRRIARYILAPPMPRRVSLTTPARPAWAAAATVAAATLPRWTRRMYGLPGLPTTDLAARVALRSLAAAVTLAPERYRVGPHLRAARDRVARTAA